MASKKKLAPDYSSESLMFRSTLGIVLIALGVLTLISIVGGLRGSVFLAVRRVAQGIGGAFCVGIPVFLIWGGGLIAFSARHKAPVRPILLLLGFYFCLTAIINLLSSIGTSSMIDYVIAYNRSLTPPATSPDGFFGVLSASYQLCLSSGSFGGAMGMLLAWPLWAANVGTTGGVVLLGFLSVACLLFFSRFDVVGLVRSVREKTDAALAQREAEKQQKAYQEQMEAMQQAEQQQGLKKPAYQRRREQPEAQPVPPQYAMAQQPVYPNYPAQPVQQPQTIFNPTPIQGDSGQLYDEMIIPELPGSDRKPGWKLELPFRRKGGAVQEEETAPDTVIDEPIPAAADRKTAQRMEAIRRRKEELQQEMANTPETPQVVENAFYPPMMQPETAAPSRATPVAPAPASASVVQPVIPMQPVMPAQPAMPMQPAMHAQPIMPVQPAAPAAEPPVDLTESYRRPAGMPKQTTARQEVPMSGERLDTPKLKIPPKSTAASVEPPQKQRPPYAYPTLELLNLKQQQRPDTREQDAQNAVRLEKTLESFNIPARVQRVTHGPAVTRFELGLVSSGINVKRIMSISDNIALDMAANGGVRIEIPIPGTNLFGIEVPNKEITGVTLAEVLTSPEMTSAKSPLAVALGRDITGKSIICDLAKMPHLLIAGQTGSGKSVCINSIINSLLYRSTPEQVRMIMIDPKVVELQCYNVVPHLLIPVVSDPHKASGALAWAVQEMVDRYHKMQSKGVRELSAYNAKLEEGEEPLPRIVIVIDELADLMLACKKEVEESIIRLAQLARASGIHMVVATQRPTVDVITGLIKSNIPSRIAFAVSSNTDSRTILDTVGAEKLLGRGDMFYFPTGANAPLRVQGCYLSDAEIENVVNYIGAHSEPDYNETINEVMESENEPTPSGEDSSDEGGGVDDRLQEAIEMVLTDGQASISMLQRRMKVGYARAGRLIDDMATRGIVSKSAGSKPREILMSYDEYLRLKDSLLK